MVKFLGLVVVLVAFVVLGLPATAFGAYRSQLAEQYKLDAKAVTCAYCHESAAGGAPWNAFGQRVQNTLTNGEIAKALYVVLQDKADSDGDGYEDALEVFAGSLPGDAKSRPLVRVEALRLAFEKAGGVEQYKP